ncbi:hypothetical protein L1987_82028 [Smallanthus sonchifolius]|uniref:Uncharacterized protein n=2 Tax=Smallanthus sonchifolius TaxID=185202 RepID=A0ACB8YSQ5_9ASTR|nr:hypothetical protein L1987_82000 [Smallanthus sonchifolius]KAI3688317.1 hypothetical protein L1987_82028 [Smallanthus sonchifolius]
MATTVSTPLLMLSLFFILNSIPIPSFSCPSHHKQALLHFKSTLTKAINSGSFELIQLKSWNSTSDCCFWEHVNCAGTKTVTELHLDGVIVPLPDIDPVPILSNILAPLFHTRSCQIPSQLFELKSIHVLDLSDNTIEGDLSAEVGKLVNLESLYLGGNFLLGKIPQEIGNLSKFREFSLQNNHFFGGIPSSIENLKKLEILDLAVNSFSMQIPNFIGKLSSMIALDLSKNQFTGPIPSSMQNLSKLELLHLHENMLNGEIPT